MIQSEEHFRSLTDAFHAAAINGEGWYSALDALAQATGSQTGELICIGAEAAVPINIMTNMDPGFHAAFVAAGGGDPRINPRVRAGMAAPILKVLAESDFITQDEYKRDPHYQEFALPWNVPYICLATLDREPSMLIGLAVVRTHQQGHITAPEREAFAAIAPHVRAAVRTHLALENHGAAVLTGAMEALAMPAFVCDRAGRVITLTPTAEAFVTSERGLQLKNRCLLAHDAADAKALSDAIEAAAARHVTPQAPMLQTVVLRNKATNAAPVVLDVIALPRGQYELRLTPRVLVVARGSRGAEERKAAVLQAAYSLTPAESGIAIQLSQGATAEAIAAARKVTVGTVRTQIKAILAKTGANRQIDLVARLNQL